MLLAEPLVLAIALGLGLLILLPARRLQLAGLAGRTVGAYALCLWLLGFLLAIRPVATRFLLPILLIAYLAPFVVAPERVARVLRIGRGRRGPPRPPIKNVTPPPDGPAGQP